MNAERVWVVLSQGISPELSEPIFSAEVDRELADAEPVLVAGLRRAVRSHLERQGIFPVDDPDA